MLNARHLLERKTSGAIHSVGPDDSVLTAIRRMAEHHIGALLVMEGERLVGIVSERDYARKVVLQDRSSRDTRVAGIMATPVITVSPTTTLDECMQTVTQRRIRHLPVVDGERVVGVLSIGDLVKAVIDEKSAEIEQLQAYITR